MRGVVIAGTHSGCGKTTVTLGILAALRKKGLTVQPFKVGPDFIDTGLHKLITGRTSRNLDLWMCGRDYATDCFSRHSEDADISVVEGVMGMYDGNICTADLAASLGLPVILVVDAYGMAESAGAVIKGFRNWGLKTGVRGQGLGVSEKPITNPFIAGIVFNRIASGRHYQRVKDSVQDIPVLGYLPRDLAFEIPHRHLGLTVAEEVPISTEAIDKLADAVLRHIDVDYLIQHSTFNIQHLMPGIPIPNPQPLTSALKIAVARDKAFCFYYEDNLDLLREAGAEIVTFSPLSDSRIPDNVHALYFGGGYPELYARELSVNKTMLDSIRDFADNDRFVYAECGGFMYLTNGICIKDNNPLSPFSKGEFFKMAGIFPFETQMKDKLSRLGYREITLKEDCILGKKSSVVRGHEFHYSEIAKDSYKGQVTSNKLINSTTSHSYSVKDSYGNNLQNEGYKIKNTLGSYMHIHFGSNREIATNFIEFMKVCSKVCHSRKRSASGILPGKDSGQAGMTDLTNKIY